MNDLVTADAPMALGRRIALTGKALRSLTDAALTPHGADLHTWIILNQADRHAGGLAASQRQLADGLQMSGPALVRHLDRLEGEGLVRRRRDEHDRRVTRILPTPKGRRLLSRLRAVMEAHDEQLRSQLTATEARNLERALAKLHAYATSALPHLDPERP